MNKQKLRELLSQKIFLLDGATGTELQKRGMPAGVCPEQWAVQNPDVIKQIQRAYSDAGSDIVYTCTFGGNRIKLGEFGLGGRTVELNRVLAKLSREAVRPECLVAGDLSSTGRFIKPLGDMPFEECVNVYKEQVQGLLEGGVDLFVIETMLDLQEARAALLAVRESCELPVFVTMTFDESKRTLTGTDPVTALITLQSLGADAVGCNCSTGPAQMAEIISLMKPYARVPLLAKPNAGLPRLLNGKTVFDMDAKEFGSYAKTLAEAGANLLGGCCGTSPAFISELKRESSGLEPDHPESEPYSAVTSSRRTVFLGAGQPVTVIGERVNPTGKKKLQSELREGSTQEVRRLALEQVEKGAGILDVNVGMPGIDEKSTMVRIVEVLGEICDAPLCLDSSSPEVLEAALRIYPGRALINSISQEKIKLEKLLPIAAKYGAMFILLPLGDGGVPEKASERQKIIENVYERAETYGYRKCDIVADGLVMTVSSNQEAAVETLKLIEWCTREFGCGTVIGLSNVSFGLPERGWVNAAFLAMAIDRGLTAAIANPSSELLMNIKMACDVLTAKDAYSQNYIAHFSMPDGVPEGRGERHTGDSGTQAAKTGADSTSSQAAKAGSGSMYSQTSSSPVNGSTGNEQKNGAGDEIYAAVLKGNKEIMPALIDKALNEKIEPKDLVDHFLIPAINWVGKLFDEKKYFLPQLIQSAETMRKGFDVIEPLLKKDCLGGERNETVIVLATVKGDIHDIGKNIVALMLRNYGYKVHDLGKDVSAERIAEEARRLGARIIGLSALMTTTMVEMEEVIKIARSQGLKCKFMIGGAVVDEGYARQIGADGYSGDAYEAVKLAGRLAQD